MASQVKIRVRPVAQDDWAQFEILLAGICRYHGDQHALTREQFNSLAMGDAAPVTVLVAETEEGILAGYVAGFALYTLQQGETSFEIQNLFVAEEFRRQHIGEVLMISIMQAARRKHGSQSFRLGALKWNEAALEFYRQLGFVPNTKAQDTARLVRAFG